MFLSGSGNLGIGTTNPLSALSIGIDGDSRFIANMNGTVGDYHRVIQATQPTNSSSATETNHAIVGSIPSGPGGYKLYGVYGSAYRGSTPIDHARSYGVWGMAGNGHNGFNYGVYGFIQGSRNGAAVFGTVSGDVSVPDKLAGFFYGNVDIWGDLTVTGTFNPSDINLKKEIRTLDDDVITKLSQLQVITYKLKHWSEYKELSDTINITQIEEELQSDMYTRDRIGLIAQELQITFPEVVKPDKEGYLKVDYIQLIPILVKAITDQQTEIEKLRSQIYLNKSVLESQLFSSLTSIEPSGGDPIQKSTLFQNAPNPFTEETKIEYFLEDNVRTATMYIYDMSGKQLRSYCLLYTSPSPRDRTRSRMPSSA